MTDEDAAVVSAAQQVQALRAEVDQLREALESREAIGQAKGIIRLLTHADSDDAFELLAQLSQHSNLKLRDAAVLIADCASSGTALPGPVAAVWRQLMSQTQPGDKTVIARDGAVPPPPLMPEDMTSTDEEGLPAGTSASPYAPEQAEKVSDEAVQKGGDAADKATGDKFSSQIDSGQHKADDAIGS